jgi:glycosyltransferase involved in cell wall biosynthesis
MHGPPTDRLRVGRLLRGMDALVSPSESIRDQVRRDHGVEARLIPMGIDLDRFAPADRSQARRRVGWDERPVVFFTGRLIVEKDIATLLRAFALVAWRRPEARLKIAGEGVMGEALRREAAALGIADRVDFLGTVRRSDLPPCYAAADVQVIPSLYENFPMVSLEALACGARLIVSDGVPAVRTRFPEVASFPVGDHEALAALLLAGLDGRLPRVERSRLAPHAWEKIAGAYMDLYLGLTARRAA